MKKIQLASQILRVLFLALCLIMPLIYAYFILFHMEDMLNWGIWAAIIPPTLVHQTHYSFLHRLVILSIELIPLSMSLMVFNNLAKLFSLYGKGILWVRSLEKFLDTVEVNGQQVSRFFRT